MEKRKLLPKLGPERQKKNNSEKMRLLFAYCFLCVLYMVELLLYGDKNWQEKNILESLDFNTCHRACVHSRIHAYASVHDSICICNQISCLSSFLFTSSLCVAEQYVRTYVRTYNLCFATQFNFNYAKHFTMVSSFASLLT